MPVVNILACLDYATFVLGAYLRSHPDGPIHDGVFEVKSNGIYFGVVSAAAGTLTYTQVLATVFGFTLKMHQDGYTGVAADIWLKGPREHVIGYSVLQWAGPRSDES